MVRKNFYLTDGQVDFLEGLRGLSVAEHVRRAIDDYIQKERSISNVTTSASKMKIFHHGKEVTNE